MSTYGAYIIAFRSSHRPYRFSKGQREVSAVRKVTAVTRDGASGDTLAQE